MLSRAATVLVIGDSPDDFANLRSRTTRRLSIDYVARSFQPAQPLEGLHRHARDQWLRAAQSTPVNIAKGNGKRSLKDRARFLDIARGSALECAVIQDVLVTTKSIKVQHDAPMKAATHVPAEASSGGEPLIPTLQHSIPDD